MPTRADRSSPPPPETKDEERNPRKAWPAREPSALVHETKEAKHRQTNVQETVRQPRTTQKEKKDSMKNTRSLFAKMPKSERGPGSRGEMALANRDDADDPERTYHVAIADSDGFVSGDSAISDYMSKPTATKLAKFLARIIPDSQFAIDHREFGVTPDAFGGPTRAKDARYQIRCKAVGAATATFDKDVARFRLRCLAALTGTKDWWIYDSATDTEVDPGYYSAEPTENYRPRKGKAGKG